jgi:hypothetical protein
MKTKVPAHQQTQPSDSTLEKIIAIYRREFGSEWIEAFKQTVKLDYQDLSL